MNNRLEKTLTNILRKTAIISSMAVPLVFASCEEENYAPEARLEVNPTYGEAPLEVRMKVTGTDADGVNDIYWYNLNVNNQNIKRKYPIDTTITFPNSGVVKVYGEVVDSKNQIAKTNPVSVEVYGKPFIEQSASLFNDIEIKYTVTLSRVDKAELKVNREGVLLLTEEVKDINKSGIDYSKTFNNAVDGITKGNYEFVLKSENLEKKNSVVVPNYNPTSNIGNIKIDLDEESDITTTLPTPLDKNPEDNPVAIKSAKSLDGKTELTLNGYDLKIKALPNYIGAYQVEIEYGSTAGGLEKAVLQGQIIEDTRIEVNPFESSDENGIEYNALKTKTERDDFIQTKLKANNGNNIPFSINPPYNCAFYSLQLFVDSKNLGEKIHTISNDFGKYWLYNNYKGNNLDSIYKNGGTLEKMGTIGAPIILATLFDISNGYFGHGMNAILTGNDLTKWEDWNFIEPQQDAINVQPGQWKIPKDCDEVLVYYLHLIEDKIQGNYLKPIILVKFRIENGIPSLIWKNDDPNLNLITQRGK